MSPFDIAFCRIVGASLVLLPWGAWLVYRDRAAGVGHSSLFGLSHGIIDQSQYSALVAAVIASAVIPTVIANALYLPRHLLPEAELEQGSDGRREVTQLRAVAGKGE